MFRAIGNFFTNLFHPNKPPQQAPLDNNAKPVRARANAVVQPAPQQQQQVPSSYNGRYVNSVKKMVDYLSGPQFEPNKPQQLDSYLQNIRIHFKESASDTVVIFGHVRDPPVVEIEGADLKELQNVTLKVSFPSIQSYANNLVVERQIIGHVFRELLSNQHSPNVIAFYRDLFAPTRLSMGGPENTQVVPILNRYCAKTGKSERKTLQAVYDQEVNKLLHPPRCQVERQQRSIQTDAQCHILMMEYVSTGSLGELFDVIWQSPLPQLSESDFVGLFVQVYHVLACFARKGMRHNDLHLDNLLVKVLQRHEELRYWYPVVVDGVEQEEAQQQQLRVVQTRFLVKIYDMDRGTIYDQVNRNMLDDTTFCLLGGECNLPSNKFDVAGFNMCALRALYRAVNNLPQFNPHLVNVVNRMIQLLRDQLIVTNNWNQFRATQYPQLWLREVEYPRINSMALVNVKTPIECLNMLAAAFPVPGTSTATNSSTIPEFRLPAQEKLHLGHPRQEYLGPTYYRDIVAALPPSKWQTNLTGPATELFQKYLNHIAAHSKTSSNNMWAKMVRIWSQELALDAANYIPPTASEQYVPVASWTEAAASLWVSYTMKNRGKTYTNPAALLAFLNLSCPMYYGMEDAVRREFINNWDALARSSPHSPAAAVIAVDANAWKTVLSYELSIWNTLGTILPINIFQLYPRHPLGVVVPTSNPEILAPPLVTIPQTETKQRPVPLIMPKLERKRSTSLNANPAPNVVAPEKSFAHINAAGRRKQRIAKQQNAPNNQRQVTFMV